MDQRLQHKNHYTEHHRRERGNKPRTHWPKDHFVNIIQVAQILRVTINKWDLLKLRSFCKAKDTVNKTELQPTEW